MEKLINVLNYIKEKYPSEIDNGSCIKHFRDVYITGKLRHSYAELSKYCEKLCPDERVILIEKLDTVLNTLSTDNNFQIPSDEVEQLKKQIGKLADHLELESLRITRLESIKNLENKISQNYKDTQKLANESKAKMKSLNDEISNINTQIVSVIGIFTGIVITIFGSMSLFSSVFSNLDTVSGFKLTLISLIIGFLTFNTIAFMFVAISHLVGKPLILVKKSSPTSDYIKSIFWFVNIVSTVFIIIVSFLWSCFELELYKVIFH